MHLLFLRPSPPGLSWISWCVFPVPGKIPFFPRTWAIPSQLNAVTQVSARPLPPIHLGIRCVLILPLGSEAFGLRNRFVHSTSPHPSRPLSPRAGQLSPLGRQARAARGPRAPVPVAVLAAGQGFGGSDVYSRAEEAGHVAERKGGSDVRTGGRANLEATPRSPEKRKRLLPGRSRDARAEVT